MVIIIYCLAVILFCVAFYFTKLLNTCSQIVIMAKQALSTVTDKSLGDEAKEKAAKVAAVNIFKNSFFLLFKILITIGAAILPLWLADIAGMANFSDTSEFALRLDVLLLTTIVASAIAFLGRKLLSKQ